ncbi:RHS repeat-associated core domain-containing protein, partial [Erwinia sorbitola]
SDREGNTVWRPLHTGLFGVIRREESRLSPYAARQNLRFAGQYYDEETGLHYNTLRYYDPGSGSFTQPDPIGLRGGLNLYAYAPNPLIYIDPLGLSPYDPIAVLDERGYTGVTRTSGGGLDYSGSNALYNKRPGVNPIVKIYYTGDYDLDFRAANVEAGLNQVTTPRGYVWHHLDDYDPVTNRGTMQLIETPAHRGISHNGGVSQYKVATGQEYTHPARNNGGGRC